MSLLPEQIKRLRTLGDVKMYDTLPMSGDEWLKRCEGYNIICSGKYGLAEKIYDNKNVFYSLPFVAVGWIDTLKLKENNITVSYCPGCNRHAVSEWIVGMTLLLFRKFNKLVNTKSLVDKTGSKDYLGLAGKTICILGKGAVGTRVGSVCKAFDMKVVYFERGDNLAEKVKNADLVVNCLSSNATTEGLLDKKFFNSLKQGSFFITVTSQKIYDSEAMIKALDNGVLAGVADDCGSILPGNYDDDYYKKISRHPMILATPHISYQSDVTIKTSNDMMIDNVEAWTKGNPINVIN